MKKNIIETERHILACMLSGQEYAEKGIELLSVDDFQTGTSKDIFTAFKALNDGIRPVDYVLSLQKLAQCSLYPEASIAELEKLPESLITGSSISYYAAILKNYSDRLKTRELMLAYLKSQSSELPMSKTELISQLETYEILDFTVNRNRINAEIIDEFDLLNKGDLKLLGDSTGYAGFDSKHIRLKRGQVMMLIARPSNGKTMMALNLAKNLGKNNHRTLFVSYESKPKELETRMIYAESRISENAVREQKATDNDQYRFVQASKRIMAYPIDYMFKPDMAIDDLRSQVRQYQRKHPDLHSVIIDYVQNIPVPKMHTADSEYRKATMLSRQVTNMIKELNVCGIFLVQLNRNADGRSNKRPIMSDMRDSGQLEQDADVILGLHREFCYSKNQEDYNSYEVAILKNRDGMLGVIQLTAHPEMKLITDFDMTAGSQ